MEEGEFHCRTRNCHHKHDACPGWWGQAPPNHFHTAEVDVVLSCRRRGGVRLSYSSDSFYPVKLLGRWTVTQKRVSASLPESGVDCSEPPIRMNEINNFNSKIASSFRTNLCHQPMLKIAPFWNKRVCRAQLFPQVIHRQRRNVESFETPLPQDLRIDYRFSLTSA